MKTIIDEIEKIFRENGIEESQAEAKLLVCEISNTEKDEDSKIVYAYEADIED